MKWLELTGPSFKKYLSEGKGVAVLPCGSIEKHGEHLPLGTDTFNVEYACREACEKAGALMLPALPYLFVNEMKASAGAVSLSAKTILSVIEEICDEVSRNGIRKIILVNGHGGNNFILMSFIQDLPGKGKDYAAYYLPLMSCGKGEKWEKALAMGKAEFPGGHADDVETDAALFTSGDFVDLDAISPDKSAGASRLDFDVSPAKAQTWWYAEFPDSLSGDPRFPNKERGRLLVEAIIENLADALRRIRDDEKVAERNRRFEEEARDPSKMR